MSYQGWSDFRSDTVTRPTPEMRKAMAEAEVDDDVLGRDPTAKRLEEMAAERVGKEAALFVASGTMANTLALLSHDVRGREVIVEERCHILNYEAGNIGHICGAVPRSIPTRRGCPSVEEVAARIQPAGNMHSPPTAGVCLENSHNYHGGAVMPLASMAAIHALAASRGLFLHLDGARLFNSAATLGCDAREIAGRCDTLMFCLSKGLGAPAGSMLAGPAAFIAEARRIRKQLGGAMRQVGILAAAGIVALEKMTGRLADDHRRARALAAGITAIDGLRIDPAEVESNIVIFNITRPERKPSALCEALRGDGVLCMPFGPGRVRLVTHCDVDDKDVEKALSVLNKAMK